MDFPPPAQSPRRTVTTAPPCIHPPVKVHAIIIRWSGRSVILLRVERRRLNGPVLLARADRQAVQYFFCKSARVLALPLIMRPVAVVGTTPEIAWLRNLQPTCDRVPGGADLDLGSPGGLGTIPSRHRGAPPG
jgi:hypothetical protein